MWSKHGTEGRGFGIAFYGDKGTLLVDEKGWHVEDPDGGKPEKPLGGKATNGFGAHVQNFLDCVKSREKPNADIEVGHLSTRLCHLGNIASRTGKKLIRCLGARRSRTPPRPTSSSPANTASGSRCRLRSERRGGVLDRAPPHHQDPLCNQRGSVGCCFINTRFCGHVVGSAVRTDVHV